MSAARPRHRLFRRFALQGEASAGAGEVQPDSAFAYATTAALPGALPDRTGPGAGRDGMAGPAPPLARHSAEVRGDREFHWRHETPSPADGLQRRLAATRRRTDRGLSPTADRAARRRSVGRATHVA